MADEFHFNNRHDAETEIRAAVRYLLRESSEGNLVGSNGLRSTVCAMPSTISSASVSRSLARLGCPRQASRSPFD
jgi:hypothetical protein